MALSVSLLTQGKTTTDATSFTTASVTLTLSRREMLWVCNSKASSPNTPTVSGWTNVATSADPGNTTVIHLFTRIGDGSTGTHTIDFGANTQTSCSWWITEWNGTLTPRIVQSKTSNGEGTAGSVTLDAAVLATDTTAATVGGCLKQSSGVFTPGTDFTESVDDGQTVPTTRWEGLYDIAPTDNVIDCSWATTEMWSMIGAELSETASGTDATVTPSTVAGVAAVGSPAESTGSTFTPSVVAGVATVGAPALSTGSTVTPAVVPLVASVGSPTISTAGGPAPATVAATASVGAPTLSMGTTVTPVRVAATATVGSPMVTTGAPAPHLPTPTHAAVGASRTAAALSASRTTVEVS